MITVDRYRELALAFDGAIESAHMGHPDFRVNGRIFCTIQTDERGGLMLTPDQQRIFVRDRPSAFVPENGAWGLQGATRVIFAEVDEETLGEALTLAWQNRALATPTKAAAPKVAKKATTARKKPAPERPNAKKRAAPRRKSRR